MRAALALVVALGCGSPPAPDAGAASDAGRRDADAAADASPAGSDAGPLVDAAPRIDAAPLPDAGAPICPDRIDALGPISGPQGVMVQTHTASDLCLLERALHHVCRAHQDGEGAIHDLVLTDVVGSEAGRPTEALDEDVLRLVLRYRDCFDNLFFGTLPEVVLDRPYDPATINDEDARWTWLRGARRVADALVAFMDREAPGLAWHWYVSYEANLNAFTDVTYRGSYVALLLQHVDDLTARHATDAVFWSPTFWTDPDALSAGGRAALSAAIGDTFARVPGITWVAIQDHLGVARTWTCDDALDYLAIVGDAAPGLASLQLNVEYFELEGGSIRAGDPDELAARVACYRGAGASLGASFDFRYWYPSHGHGAPEP